MVSIEDRLIRASLNSYTGKDKAEVEELMIWRVERGEGVSKARRPVRAEARRVRAVHLVQRAGVRLRRRREPRLQPDMRLGIRVDEGRGSQALRAEGRLLRREHGARVVVVDAHVVPVHGHRLHHRRRAVRRRREGLHRGPVAHVDDLGEEGDRVELAGEGVEPCAGDVTQDQAAAGLRQGVRGGAPDPAAASGRLRR